MADDARPLQHPTAKLKPADPCAMVLFGATGDLAKRLVVPALYNLEHTGVPKSVRLTFPSCCCV